MAKIKYYLRDEDKENSPIAIVFAFHDTRLRLSTGISIPVKAWDQATQKLKPPKEYVEENAKLRKIEDFLKTQEEELFEIGIKYSREEVLAKAEEIKLAFQVFTGRKKEELLPKHRTFFTYIDEFRERYKNQSSHGYLKHYIGIKTHLQNFQKTTDYKVTFESIGKEFYLKFMDYLKEQNMKPNTIGSHIKRVKRLMNEANEDGLTTNKEHLKREFKTVKEEVDSVYLTLEEIDALYKMEILPAAKAKMRDLLVLNCYTGLRHSDWDKVNYENIKGNKLYVRTQKTKEPVIIPIKPLVAEILKKYGTIECISLQKSNEAIKWIGHRAYEKNLSGDDRNKWLKIRTHTARRSFATNAYLMGIPMRDIMQITGHRTTESFLKYIRVTKLETAEKLKDHPFFS